MRRLLTALTLVLAASLVATVPSALAGPAIPIPSDPRDLLLRPFTGAPAIAKPLPLQQIPQHPYMARNGGSNIHNDAYQSDTYNRRGPLGKNLTVKSTAFLQDCGSVTFDKAGRIVTVCVGVDAVTLRRLDPQTLESLAEFALPRRPARMGNPFQNFSGGGYFYLDNLDRAVVPTFDGHVVTIRSAPPP